MKTAVFLFVTLLLLVSCDDKVPSESMERFTLDLFKPDGIYHLGFESKKTTFPRNEYYKKVYSSGLPVQAYKKHTYAVHSWRNAISLVNLETNKDELIYQFPDKYSLSTIGIIDDNNIWCSTSLLPFKGKYKIWRISRRDKIATLVFNAISPYFSHVNGLTAYIGEDAFIHVEGENMKKVIHADADVPTLLPNGQGIVYINYGFLQSIDFRLFSSLEAKTIEYSYFGQFEPLIQISKDSNKIAFTWKSDVFSVPIEVFDLKSSQKVLSVERSKHWILE